MIEIEVQNETTQTEERLRFAAVPRIGEGISSGADEYVMKPFDHDTLQLKLARIGLA